jgi:phenylalanyl-tRNA synthetase beta chain
VKFSEQWLREWVNPALAPELAHQITMAGLEVDAMEPVAGAFAGVVVGEIIRRAAPGCGQAARVQRRGRWRAPLQIVCGAPNARVGLKAPLAMVGAVLPGDFAIKAAKLRGVESQGMLCAAAGAGLSEDKRRAAGAARDAPVGATCASYLQLEDVTIEIGLTPNRADCLGMPASPARSGC